MIEFAFDSAEANFNAGRHEQAAQICWEIVKRAPKHAGAWSMMALIEAQAGRYRNAMLYHGHALQAAPNTPELWCNRGVDAAGARMYAEAEQSFEKAIALRETFEGHFNYANILCQQMKIDESVPHYEAAFKFGGGKESAQLHVNYGSAIMSLGRWQEGFIHYRQRFDAPAFPPRPRLNYPVWSGEPIDGKTILLFAEQGFGDEIMSLRFAKTVKDMGAQVIVAVRPQMFRLAKTFQHADAVIVMYEPPPWEPDYMCALLDVPAFIDMDPASVPLKAGYLTAEDRGFRLGMPKGLNIGICWASGKRDLQPHVAEVAKQKSVSFEALLNSIPRAMVNIFSLQQTHGDDTALRAHGVSDPMAGVVDFADTAFIIDHLDLVVTVDTSVAHLAGALGKPVWNLTRFDALWPWMRETGDTCWYDSMKLYRQTRLFDWSDPLKRLRADLNDLVERTNLGAIREELLAAVATPTPVKPQSAAA